MEHDFKTSIYERICELHQTDELSDVEFHLIDGENVEKVKGHRLLFGIASPEFKTMFYGSIPEGDVITIKDVEPRAFKTMKTYLYTNDVVFESFDHATAVYQTADKYNLPHLQKVAEEYAIASLNVQNVIEIMEFFNLYNVTHIEKMCMDLIKSETVEVINSDGFLNCSQLTLKKLIKENELNLHEVDLFCALEKWIFHNSKKQGVPVERLITSLSPIIREIRFLCMTPVEFVGGPSHSKLLSDGEILSLLKYITQPGSCDLPRRFSILTTQRNPNSEKRKMQDVLVTWTIDNVSSIQLKELLWSSEFYLNDMPWRIQSVKEVVGDEEQLKFSLICFADEKSYAADWSCNGFASLEIFAQYEGCKNIKSGNITCKFSKDTSGNDCSLYSIEWSELINPENGFIKDDKMKIEVQVSLTEKSEDKVSESQESNV